MLGEAFSLIYELDNKRMLVSCNANIQQPGFNKISYDISGDFKFVITQQINKVEKVINLAYNFAGKLIFAFVPADIKYVENIKRKVEHKLSRYGVRFTRTLGLHSGSMQMELFYKYDERKMLEFILDMLNKIIFENGRSYKFFILISSKDFDKLYKLIEPNLFTIELGSINFSSIGEVFEKLSGIDSIPISSEYASGLVSFPSFIKRLDKIQTDFPRTGSDIILGEFLEDSIKSSSINISINKSALNLGSIITGMPGTGKTYAAMSIAEQAFKSGSSVVIISPTKEWASFAVKNNLKLIRLYSSNNFCINFFKSDTKLPIEKFYENLAMLIASASNAGPYKNSLEKVLLAAFHKVYKLAKDPDPQDVYEAIEEAIIEQHGKRTNVGVKYTKHGENTMAALENLRLMLSRPEFAQRNGIDFNKLFKSGVVFDLSEVSNNMKAFFYALILNQVYNIVDTFAEDGDDKLRLLLVLEEAQLAFGDELSAPTLDLRERIQDFRKKGIGLILITHNITDISPAIRRLCQNKFYFRQSSDIVKLALSDLGFGEEASNRLRYLERGVCAMSYVYANGKERLLEGPVFVKVNEFNLPEYRIKDHFTRRFYTNVKLNLGSEYNDKLVELYYLGEKISSAVVVNGEVTFDNLIIGKRYKLLIPAEHKKDTKSMIIKAEALPAKEPTLV
ncbi:MAG: DUF87 domain-containing protein [Candidatus Micrarchaeota archaeon]